jgi:hypothetical protein
MKTRKGKPCLTLWKQRRVTYVGKTQWQRLGVVGVGTVADRISAPRLWRTW